MAWDAADSSAPLQPPRPDREGEGEEEEEDMDTAPPGENSQEVSRAS